MRARRQLTSHRDRIFVQITAVGLQMHDAAWFKEVAVTVHEQRSCKALLLTSDLRISKGDPDFRNFAWGEEGLYELDTCADKSDILKSMFLSIFGALPKARTFDVYTDIVT